MINYLAIQNTYQQVEFAVCKNGSIIDSVSIPKILASKSIITSLSTLLSKNNLSLHDLSCIGVNQGPGPFTTLRVIIATVNGLAYATQIPIIGIDALEAIVQEHKQKNYPLVALLNAFNNDVYYAICNEHGAIVQKNYGNIDVVLQLIDQLLPTQQIIFTGNAIPLFSEQIHQRFGKRLSILDADTCSLSQIARMTFDSWQSNSGISKSISPLYLKQNHYKKIIKQ